MARRKRIGHELRNWFEEISKRSICPDAACYVRIYGPGSWQTDAADHFVSGESSAVCDHGYAGCLLPAGDFLRYGPVWRTGDCSFADGGRAVCVEAEYAAEYTGGDYSLYGFDPRSVGDKGDVTRGTVLCDKGDGSL